MRRDGAEEAGHDALASSLASLRSASDLRRCDELSSSSLVFESVAKPADGYVEEVGGRGERVEECRSGREGTRDDTDASSLAPLLSASILHLHDEPSGSSS